MKGRTAIIWDLDKTLYPFDAAFGTASKRALVRMIRDLEIGGLSLPAAEVYAESAYPMKTISKLQRDFGHSAGEMFARYYDCLDEGFLKPSGGFLAQVRRTEARFGILSHCTRGWADRAVRQLGLGDFIDPDHIVTIEDLNGVSKDEGPQPFQEILRRMGAAPGRAVMVEDKDKNLKHARALGMKTVLVTNGDEMSTADYAHHVHPTGQDFLRAFNEGARGPVLRPELPGRTMAGWAPC